MSKTITFSPEAFALLSAYIENDGDAWCWDNISQTDAWEDFTREALSSLVDDDDAYNDKLDDLIISARKELKEQLGLDIS